MKRPLTTLCTMFIIIFFPYALSISRENDIKVIVDVLRSFNKPSNVIANICWKDTTSKKLMTNLAENQISIKFVNKIHDKNLGRTEHVIFLTDITCKRVAEYLNKAASRKYFGRPYRWFIVDRTNSEMNIPPELYKKDLLPDSEVYIMHFKYDSYFINLIYKINANRNWIIENYGNWTVEDGLTVSRHVKETAMALRRKNLDGEIIVNSAIISDNNTLADLELLRYKEVDPVTKSGHHQLSPLYDFMNATRGMVVTISWGYHINGTWTGMLGDLSEHRAEIAGLVMYMTTERMAVVEYLSHPTTAMVKFIFREPPLSYQNNVYLLPFKATVWYCIGSFVVVLIGIMYVNAYWEVKKGVEEKESNDPVPVLVPTVSEVTVFVISAISQQGSTVELKGTLGRSVILILFLVFVFLYTAYSASIVVLLQASSNQIRTLSDLLNSKLELGVEDTPYNRYWFMTEKDPVRRAIYEKKVAPSGSKPKFFDLVDGVLQLQKKPFAFNCNLGTAYKLIEKYFYEHEKCGLQEISYIQAASHTWQSCRKGSPYREIFKLGLLRNTEHGLDDRTNRIMFTKKPVCLVRGGSFVSVSLVDCYPVMLLLLYGMILGVVLLLAEILYHRKTSG